MHAPPVRSGYLIPKLSLGLAFCGGGNVQPSRCLFEAQRHLAPNVFNRLGYHAPAIGVVHLEINGGGWKVYIGRVRLLLLLLVVVRIYKHALFTPATT